jgi:hypothetical protein
VPWSKQQNHDDCPADRPWAVVKDDDGELEGCHATEAEADEQIAALYAAEDEDAGDAEALGGKPNKGTKKDKRLHENNPKTKSTGDGETFETSGTLLVAEAGEDGDESDLPTTWTGVLVVEGVTTGDQREFSEGSLTWADPPLTLRWNVEDSHGGMPQTKAVAVGNITEVWRDGNKIMGRGSFDLGSEDGREARRRVHEQYLRGVSIDADDITDADVELIWPEKGPDDSDSDEGSIFDQLFASPEKVIYNAGRIRAATLCDIPAFVEAYIELDGTTGGEALAAAATLQLGAVGTHTTATSDAAWDADTQQSRLPTPLSVDTARSMYAWLEDGATQDGQISQSACKFPHHEVDADGKPGPANLTACSAGIGVLNGSRGGSSIPDGQRRGVYNHLAKHLRDAGREAPPLTAAEDNALAASVTALDSHRPPRSWFENPRLSVPVGITVTDEGRIYGHAAQWGECHIGYSDACVTAPYEDSHPYFLTGEVVTDDGSRVGVGQITVGTNHAPLAYGSSRAAEHYDNTGAAVADVAVGNDEHGIWVAGAIRPHAEASRVHDLRAAGRVSGDWRRIGGQLRLVGLLGINVAGFQPRVKSRVASGVQVALVAAGRVTVGPKPMTDAEVKSEQYQHALREVMGQLSAKVHDTGKEAN